MILEGGITTAERKFLSFITDLNDWIEAQNFSRVHRIVANLIDADLEKELDLDPYAIDIQDATGRTPLHWAAARGNADNCRKLLNYGANLNILDIFRLSPFAYAAGRNQIACCRKLLEFGAAVDVECSRCHGVDGPLHRESHNAPHYDLAHSDFNYAAYPSAHGKYRCTPLIHAAREGQTELVLLLLRYGADTNQLSNYRPGSYLRAMDDLQIDEADEEHQNSE
jgi:ankyrin repeat protein